MAPDETEQLETVSEVARRVIVSFDVRRRRRTECTLVTRFVFGRRERVRTPQGTRVYRYPGLIARPGVERLGQSVLLMREDDAEDFTGFLSRLHVPHSAETVWIKA